MDRTAPNPMLEEKEQYHHYIPRFVLRAFAAHPQPPPVRQKKKQRKKPKKTTVQDAGDLEGVKDDCPNEVGPSNAAKKPEPATQPQPNHDEPTPPVQKMEEEEKPTEAAAKDAEDPRGVENYLLDEAVASNAPEEPEPTVYHQPTYNEPTRPVRKKKKQKKRPTKTTAKDAENPKDVENDSPDEADASNAPKEPESTAQPQPNYDEPTRPPRENKNRKKKLTKTTAGDAEDAEDFKGVEYHSPDGAGPSNAPKEPDSAAQPQPKYDEPTPRAQKSKKRRERKPAKTTAVDAEDPKGVENDSPDEVGPFNAPKEPEDTVEVEIINDTGKSKPRKSRFDPSKDPYIKFYDLESGVLDFAKVGRSYGIPDMYKDVDNERAYHVEELLSKLESGAASIYHRIKNDHESGKCNFSVTRKDLNLLRKFLFVMRYRSHKFWSKYTGTIDTYEHNDRNKLVEFLKERSITDLRQVWLMGLEVIVRTEIDADGEWLQTIGREIFEGDANMYVFHMRESYMAFCEPQSSGDEFILTNNGFGIFEGPVVFDPVNLKSGSAPRLGDSVYTEFHKLAPLSPRLILVLRSNYLRDEPIWQKRRKISNELEPRRNHDSLLQDLPIKPPKVHYWLLPKKSKLVHTLEDEFFFEIYKVKTKQVHMINTIMLEEAFRSITWVSDESLVRSLRAFLENPRFMLGAFAGFPEFQPLMALRRQKQRLLSLWDKPYPTEGMRPIEELNNTNESMKKVRYLQPYYKLGMLTLSINPPP
ncbi:hypothetical protein B9Z19DRAFT_769932 [Tuber borchii]|uniref:Uncharacterized protein n=1 Tax=Tuber borchii TaxID=42251 RepID=A0A2T6ZX11_TUBBO|nr:hypothetical protein B9Z19DRAFT_769932 [Tuber borchii]